MTSKKEEITACRSGDNRWITVTGDNIHGSHLLCGK